jgi:hypothetical protein
MGDMGVDAGADCPHKAQPEIKSPVNEILASSLNMGGPFIGFKTLNTASHNFLSNLEARGENQYRVSLPEVGEEAWFRCYGWNFQAGKFVKSSWSGATTIKGGIPGLRSDGTTDNPYGPNGPRHNVDQTFTWTEKGLCGS